jgi:hypothetical protein
LPLGLGAVTGGRLGLENGLGDPVPALGLLFPPDGAGLAGRALLPPDPEE